MSARIATPFGLLTQILQIVVGLFAVPTGFVDFKFMSAVGFAHGMIVALAVDAAIPALSRKRAANGFVGLPGKFAPAILPATERMAAERPGGALRHTDGRLGVGGGEIHPCRIARQSIEARRADHSVAVNADSVTALLVGR